MEINNPHDAIIKEVFSDKKNASVFFRKVLPADLSERIDFSTLLLGPNSFIDEELKESFSDLVYSCKYFGNRPIIITILLEHKSYREKYPHLQLLKYLLNIWKSNLKQKEPLTPVIPVILYHGAEKWVYIPFKEYFQFTDDLLENYLPSFN